MCFSAWIENSQIQPYMKYRNVLNTGSKMLSFKKSVKEVENYIATEVRFETDRIDCNKAGF